MLPPFSGRKPERDRLPAKVQAVPRLQILPESTWRGSQGARPQRWGMLGSRWGRGHRGESKLRSMWREELRSSGKVGAVPGCSGGQGQRGCPGLQCTECGQQDGPALKALAVKPGNLSLSPWIHMVEREKQLLKAVL